MSQATEFNDIPLSQLNLASAFDYSNNFVNINTTNIPDDFQDSVNATFTQNQNMMNARNEREDDIAEIMHKIYVNPDNPLHIQQNYDRKQVLENQGVNIRQANEIPRNIRDQQKRHVRLNTYYNLKRTHQVSFLKKSCGILVFLFLVSLLHKINVLPNTPYIFLIGIGLALFVILFGYTTIDMMYRDNHNYNEYKGTMLHKDDYLSDKRIFQVGEKVKIRSGKVGHYDNATIMSSAQSDGTYKVKYDDDIDEIYDVNKMLIEKRFGNTNYLTIVDEIPVPLEQQEDEVNVEEKCLSDEILSYVYKKTNLKPSMVQEVQHNRRNAENQNLHIAFPSGGDQISLNKDNWSLDELVQMKLPDLQGQINIEDSSFSVLSIHNEDDNGSIVYNVSPNPRDNIPLLNNIDNKMKVTTTWTLMAPTTTTIPASTNTTTLAPTTTPVPASTTTTTLAPTSTPVPASTTTTTLAPTSTPVPASTTTTTLAPTTTPVPASTTTTTLAPVSTTSSTISITTTNI
jgi:hypothetical protein